MAIGFSVSDGSGIARAVRHRVGDDRSDMRLLERDLSLLLGEAQGGAGMSPAILSGVLGVMERHGLRPPRALLLSRTLFTLEGTLRLIDPEFDLAAEASKLVGQDGLASVGTPADILRRELVRALPALRSLPEHAETLGGQLRSGRLVLRFERYAGGDRRVVEAWIDRVLVAVASGIGALTSGTVLVAAAMAEDSDIRDTLWVLGFSGLTAATVLLLRTVAQSLHGQSVRGE